VSYVSEKIKKKTEEPVLNALKKLGAEIVPAADMMISKSDVIEF
jgi:hypothetical protein